MMLQCYFLIAKQLFSIRFGLVDVLQMSFIFSSVLIASFHYAEIKHETPQIMSCVKLAQLTE